MAAIGLKYHNIFTKNTLKFKFEVIVFTGWIFFSVLIIIHIEIKYMSQIQEAKQFTMAAKGPKWLQESLD